MLPGLAEVQASLAVKILPLRDSISSRRAGHWEEGEGKERTKDRSRPVCRTSDDAPWLPRHNHSVCLQAILAVFVGPEHLMGELLPL